MRRVDSLEKTLMLGGIGGRRRRGWQRWDGCMASPTRWMWVWMNSGRWWWTGRPGVLRFMGSQRVGHHWATELNWTELNWGFSRWSFLSFPSWLLSLSYMYTAGCEEQESPQGHCVLWRCPIPFSAWGFPIKKQWGDGKRFLAGGYGRLLYTRGKRKWGNSVQTGVCYSLFS